MYPIHRKKAEAEYSNNLEPEKPQKNCNFDAQTLIVFSLLFWVPFRLFCFLWLIWTTALVCRDLIRPLLTQISSASVNELGVDLIISSPLHWVIADLGILVFTDTSEDDWRAPCKNLFLTVGIEPRSKRLRSSKLRLIQLSHQLHKLCYSFWKRLDIVSFTRSVGSCMVATNGSSMRKPKSREPFQKPPAQNVKCRFEQSFKKNPTLCKKNPNPSPPNLL